MLLSRSYVVFIFRALATLPILPSPRVLMISYLLVMFLQRVSSMMLDRNVPFTVEPKNADLDFSTPPLSTLVAFDEGFE